MDPMIDRIGGEPKVHELVDHFYDLIETLPQGQGIIYAVVTTIFPCFYFCPTLPPNRQRQMICADETCVSPAQLLLSVSRKIRLLQPGFPGCFVFF